MFTDPGPALSGDGLTLGYRDVTCRSRDTAIAPAQIPAGLVVAAIGAPYFVFLLYRSRV